MKMVVIGGTGLIGAKTVAIAGGHEVVAASAENGVNTITGDRDPARSELYPSHRPSPRVLGGLM